MADFSIEEERAWLPLLHFAWRPQLESELALWTINPIGRSFLSQKKAVWKKAKKPKSLLHFAWRPQLVIELALSTTDSQARAPDQAGILKIHKLTDISSILYL